MDKNFIIAYELTAQTTTKNICNENTPLKFKNWKEAKGMLDTFSWGSIFQVMTIGKQRTFKYQTRRGKII